MGKGHKPEKDPESVDDDDSYPDLSKVKGKRARHEAVLDAATKRAMTREEVRLLRKAIIASKDDDALTGRVVDLLWESSVLLALAHTAGRSFSLDELIPALNGALRQAFGADRAIIFLHDASTQTLVAWPEAGIEQGARAIRIADTIGIGAWVLANREPLLVPDAYRDPRFNSAVDQDTLHRTKEVLAAPILTPLGVAIGVGELLNGEDRSPFESRDLDLFAAAMVQVSVPLQNAWLLEQVQKQRATQKRAEGELAAGRAIQMGLLPRLPHRRDLEVAVFGVPAKPLGGDLYDLVLLDDRTLFFLIGDVAGKGVPAALFMAVVHTLFRTHARRRGHSLAEMITRLNAELWEENPEALFVTVFCGLLDLVSGDLEYAVCGHERPYLMAVDGQIQRLPGQINPAICFDPDVTYRADRTQLRVGDLLLFYTDGATEALNHGGQHFGQTRLLNAIECLGPKESAQNVVTAVKDAVEAFKAGRPHSDDMTLLALRWNGPET